MKDSVILLNTSRGKLINPASLLRALRSEKVYAAGLDGASPEPIAPDDPLLTEPNCFITPHIAWAYPVSSDTYDQVLCMGSVKTGPVDKSANNPHFDIVESKERDKNEGMHRRTDSDGGNGFKRINP